MGSYEVVKKNGFSGSGVAVEYRGREIAEAPSRAGAWRLIWIHRVLRVTGRA